MSRLAKLLGLFRRQPQAPLNVKPLPNVVLDREKLRALWAADHSGERDGR